MQKKYLMVFWKFRSRFTLLRFFFQIALLRQGPNKIVSFFQIAHDVGIVFEMNFGACTRLQHTFAATLSPLQTALFLEPEVG